MHAWILSDSEALSAAIRRSLLRLGVDCPASQELGFGDLDRLAEGDSHAGRIVFFVTRQLSAEHFEALRRVRTFTDREVAVVASAPSHGALLKTMRAGATDYLDADGKLDEEIEEFVARARSERSEPATRGKVLTIVPCHGPCDGSVLAANVAAVIAHRVGRCALLDFHLRGGDLSLLLKATPRHTIYDLARQHDRLDQNMFVQALTRHASGIALLAGPPMFSDLRQFEPTVCHRILAFSQKSFPFVVVNCEDIAHDEQIQSLAASDEIILAMRMDLVSLHRAKQHLDFMMRNRVPARRVHVVSMGAGHPSELPLSAVKSVLGVSDVHRIPDDQRAVTISINLGNPLVSELPKSAISKAIVAFVDSLPGLEKFKETPKQSLLRRAAAVLALPTVLS